MTTPARSVRAAAAVLGAWLLLSGTQAVQRPRIRTLTDQELLDMMAGSSIQASRGNNTASMVQRLKDALAQGRTFRMIAVEDLPDEWMTVTPAGVGGGGAWEYVRERTKQQNLPTVPNTTLRAVEALSAHLGRTFDAVVRVEAAGATLSALLLAADLGVPIVDACLSGRARPEIQQQVPWLLGIPSTPAALVTRWGDTVLIEKAVDDYRAEDLARAVAVASGGGASMAMNPMSGRDVKARRCHSRGAVPGDSARACRAGGGSRGSGSDRRAGQGREWLQALSRDRRQGAGQRGSGFYLVGGRARRRQGIRRASLSRLGEK